MSAGAFGVRLRGSLAGFPLAGHLTAGYETAIVVDGDEPVDRLVPALRETVAALGPVGIAPGRVFILIGRAMNDGRRGDRKKALQGSLPRETLVLDHDPARPGFTAGRLADGTAIVLDDELREAEAIVTVGSARWSPAGPCGGVALLCPGVAAHATRHAYGRACAAGAAAAWTFALAAEALAPVNLGIGWDDRGRITIGRGADVFAATARAAGCA